ncbi:MAG TPA: hypothetical protein VMB85_23495 [Bryobacteraceae bacterium]|nr:hypothetical protein [Bryobacteraceae bacterium]
MKTRIAFFVLAVFAARAEVLDRIAVSVGKQVITERDVLREVRIDAFLDRRPVEITPEQKRAAADRLVDQLLILEEAALTKVNLSTDEDARKLLDEVKAPYGADYQAALERYQITEPDLVKHLVMGLRAMRFTDLRFRPEVQISEEDLRDAYHSLIAGAPPNGKPAPSFEASREQLEKLLTDQRTAQTLDQWLETRRSATQILYHQQVFQ